MNFENSWSVRWLNISQVSKNNNYSSRSWLIRSLHNQLGSCLTRTHIINYQWFAVRDDSNLKFVNASTHLHCVIWPIIWKPQRSSTTIITFQMKATKWVYFPVQGRSIFLFYSKCTLWSFRESQPPIYTYISSTLYYFFHGDWNVLFFIIFK